MTEQAAPAPELSLREQLAQAFAAAEAGETEPEAEAAAEPEAETEIEAQTGGEETAEVEAEADEISEATWLPKEDRELFVGASEEVREAWERNFKSLQGNYTRATQELKEKGEKLSRFDQVLAPYRPMIANSGASPEQAIQYLLAQYAQLQNDPKGFVRQLATSVGLSLDAVSDQGFNSGLDDPRIKQLEQRLGQVQQTVVQSQRLQAQATERTITQQLNDFAQAPGPDGKPLHPHFAKVQDAMVPFVSQGLSLQQAYDKAVRADDELFEQIVAERTKASLKKPGVKKVATKPKASGSGIVQPKSYAEMTLKEELEARFAAGSSS